ncbi:L-threonylcarbamoyladenylate synthase [Sneathiella limimaris]|uniref:L-threonylcarbamoyladenylate synthase n=1 Tax=Sneathiella limimaris TaxID=1964213 RepID=UPI00146F344E|nr:L-threonylcarbamoyladenylate synthase [Sneathiella limimaris]
MSETDNVKKPSPESIQEAADLLNAGQLVSFSTETVYGLGADATNDVAVASIFEAKGRPSFNPLIVHVPSIDAAKELVEFSPLALKIANMFWPGPLTMVLPRRDTCPVSKLASAGLPTLAIRVPAHPTAHQLLTACKCPVAAPSANPSGQISPTTAEHVRDGLGDKVSLILDGGPAEVGVESTVIAVTDEKITLLRPGGITREDLEKATGSEVAVASKDSEITSPGMLLSHYAPSCPVRLEAKSKNEGEAFLGFGPGSEDFETLNLSPKGDLKEATANLFAMFHQLDKTNAKTIAVASVPNAGLGVAINDRLKRAAAPRG